MALRNAILAALLDGEASGYELAKLFDAAVANFWLATPQQLYRELEKMATDGLIQARMVEQKRRPNKRMFSLTDTGRAELRDFTTHPPKPLAVRDEFLVQVQAADCGDLDAVRATIDQRRTWAVEKLAHYERLRARLLNGQPEDDYLVTADRVGPYLTLLRGIAFETETITWAERALSILDRRRQRATAGRSAIPDKPRARRRPRR